MQQRKTATFTYNLIRASRKTMALKVSEDGTITVRAPYRMPVREADLFVESHRDWILSRMAAYERQRATKQTYTDEERKAGVELAKKAFSQKCRIFAAQMGVSYGRITVREQKTRWGSCSAKGNLNFNWKLVLMPEEVLDYVIVHELAHRREMNHSAAFWRVVGEVLPDYAVRRKWLKENGARY
ncbi:MAG: M48 family metallopeptidase [Clostridium sp.]|nr:M48 family metallopeptidase [Clostridium sp.]